MIQRITIDSDQIEPDPLDLSAAQRSLIKLNPEQRHYLCRVLRLGAGDRFLAQDGKGNQWLAVILPLLAQAEVVESIKIDLVLMPPLRLIAALPKGNSFDQVVRQATELGVSHIVPVMSDRTLLKPKGSKLERWRRIANEASEQSERLTTPEIASPISFQALFKQENWEGLCYICATRQNASHLLFELQSDLVSKDLASKDLASKETFEETLKKTFRKIPKENLEDLPAVNLMIGPEGGWTSEEITVAIRNGYKVVSLGSAILRATTASITALSLVAAARELLI